MGQIDIMPSGQFQAYPASSPLRDERQQRESYRIRSSPVRSTQYGSPSLGDTVQDERKYVFFGASPPRGTPPTAGQPRVISQILHQPDVQQQQQQYRAQHREPVYMSHGFLGPQQGSDSPPPDRRSDIKTQSDATMVIGTLEPRDPNPEIQSDSQGPEPTYGNFRAIGK